MLLSVENKNTKIRRRVEENKWWLVGIEIRRKRGSLYAVGVVAGGGRRW